MQDESVMLEYQRQKEMREKAAAKRKEAEKKRRALKKVQEKTASSKTHIENCVAYLCVLCAKFFSHKRSLYNHLHSSHGDQVYESDVDPITSGEEDTIKRLKIDAIQDPFKL